MSEEEWQIKANRAVNAAYILFLSDDFLLGIASAMVLIIVVAERQNKETFLIVIPTIMLMSVLVLAPHHISYYFFNHTWDHYYALVKLNQMLTMTSHWLFAAQYFMTSMIFPLIFTMVDLEISIDVRDDRYSAVTGLDT